MKITILWLAACTYYCVYSDKNTYRQEAAQIWYFNPRFINNAQGFTRRRARGEPYTSNITYTSLHQWGNNVSCMVSYYTKSIPVPLTFQMKVCNMFKLSWITDFIKSYSNMGADCPIAAGNYAFINMELPPKRFPLPIIQGKIHVNYSCFVTETKETMMVIKLNVNVL